MRNKKLATKASQIHVRAALIAVGMLVLSGCSSSGGNPPAEAGELTRVTLGYIPSTLATALDYVKEKGIFEEHGLDVDLQPNQSGAVMLPAVATGSLDFGMGNILSVLVAAEKGLDMKIVSSLAVPSTTGRDANAVIVSANSPIKSWADLEGKSVAVNAVSTLPDLLISLNVDKAGADGPAVKFSELPFSNMQAQLDSGGVDAIWTVEPFLSPLLDSGKYRLVGFPYPEAMPGLPGNMIFSSGAFASKNQETVKKFREALAEGLDAAAADPEGVRALMPGFLDVSEEVAQSVTLDHVTATIDSAVINDFIGVAIKAGRLNKFIDVNTLVVD